MKHHVSTVFSDRQGHKKDGTGKGKNKYKIKKKKSSLIFFDLGFRFRLVFAL